MLMMRNRNNVADKLQRYKETMFCRVGAFPAGVASDVGRACPRSSFAMEVS